MYRHSKGRVRVVLRVVLNFRTLFVWNSDQIPDLRKEGDGKSHVIMVLSQIVQLLSGDIL